MPRSIPTSTVPLKTYLFIRKTARLTAEILLTGFIIIMPFILLGFLFVTALNIVRGILQPVITILQWAGIIQMANFGIIGRILIEIGLYENILGVFVEFIAVLALLGTIIVLGVFASSRSGKRAMDYVDAGIAAVPGIGPIYRSFRQLGDVVLEDGLDKFRSVKILEFPHKDASHWRSKPTPPQKA